MSKEAVFMLSIATVSTIVYNTHTHIHTRSQEEFVKKLAEAGYQKTITETRQHVQYRDMGQYAVLRTSVIRFTNAHSNAANITQEQSKFKFLEGAYLSSYSDMPAR